jgi:glycosyltransferase involved in cell wall biosynthesis
MKIAIVHEMLIKFWGAERVLLELMKLYPEADIFTLMYDSSKVGDVFPKSRVKCTWPAQWFFKLTGKPRASLPLLPFSVSRIDLSGYDLVISSSSGFAHGVKKWNNAVHICYCHSPARYLWDATDEVQAELWLKNTKDKGQRTKLRIFLKRVILWPLVRLLFSWLRRVDLRASKSPDIYIANSREVWGRIQKYYNRDSVILWPPVDTVRFSHGTAPVSERNYFVVTSALTPFKQVDRVIRVMNRLNIPLKIIGDGAQRGELEKIAGKTIEFLWKISDEAVVEIYKNARGFLMPQKEDAGIAPLEALAAGVPVFWLAKWGLLEVNIDGMTGRFFPEETDESFERSFLDFDHEIGEGRYDEIALLVARAREFDAEKFRKGFQDIICGTK